MKTLSTLIVIITLIFTSCDSPSKSTSKAATPDVPSKPDIELLKVSSKSSYGSIYVYATVRNNTDKLCSYAQVNVSFYDKGDKVVGTGMGNTTNLAAGATRVVTCIAMEIENSVRYEANVENTMFQ